MRRTPQGTLSHEHSRCAGTCSERRSYRQSTACPRRVSYRETGTPVHLLGLFSGRCRRSGTNVFRRWGEPRLVVGTLLALCLPESSTPGSTPAKPAIELRRGKRRTSPISAMSCAAVVSPTPYMVRTVSYSGSCMASLVISARSAASVILPARSCCAAVVMSNLVLSFFGSVVK